MFQNTPWRFTQEDLKRVLDDTGFYGTFNLVYMPRSRTMETNLGYAFVNFHAHETAEQCRCMFDGKALSPKSKSCKVVFSKVQAGLKALEVCRRNRKVKSRAAPLLVNDTIPTDAAKCKVSCHGEEFGSQTLKAQSLCCTLQVWGTPDRRHCMPEDDLVHRKIGNAEDSCRQGKITLLGAVTSL